MFLNQFFTVGNPRTLRAKKNISISFISKGVSILISFIIVPLTLSYVGPEEYGVWMTLSSIIMWFSFFDIGLGNGLRNKLAESLALDDLKTAKIYVSSSFAIISAIAFLMLSMFFLTGHFISWNKVLNTEILPNDQLFKIVVVVVFFFCLDFVLKLVSNVLQAMQRYALIDIFGIIAQLVGLGGIYFLVKTTDGSLYNLCLVYSGKSPLIMLIAGIFLFGGSLRFLIPRIKYIHLKRALPLLNLGFKFFFNQILYLIVAQSSVILVAQFFGPSDVTVFNLALRYMTISSMLYIMVLTPFLSAFTEAFTKNEFPWIRSIIKKINFIWIFTCIITIFLTLIYKPFFHFWVGNSIEVPVYLIISLAISSIINTWGSTFSLFLNGIGKINIQTYLLVFQALVFLPLSYLFFKLNLGLVSTVLAQIILYSASAIIMTIQYQKIINKRATGIWMK